MSVKLLCGSHTTHTGELRERGLQSLIYCAGGKTALSQLLNCVVAANNCLV